MEQILFDSLKKFLNKYNSNDVINFIKPQDFNKINLNLDKKLDKKNIFDTCKNVLKYSVKQYNHHMCTFLFYHIN